MRQRSRLIHRYLKFPVYHRIGSLFCARIESRIAFEKLGREHPQAVKFREKISCRLAHRPYRIIRMFALPGRKIFLCSAEIEIVESQKASVQFRASGIQPRCGRRLPHRHAQHCYHSQARLGQARYETQRFPELHRARNANQIGPLISACVTPCTTARNYYLLVLVF